MCVVNWLPESGLGFGCTVGHTETSQHYLSEDASLWHLSINSTPSWLRDPMEVTSSCTFSLSNTWADMASEKPWGRKATNWNSYLRWATVSTRGLSTRAVWKERKQDPECQQRLPPLASSALITPTWIPFCPWLFKVVARHKLWITTPLICHEGQWDKLGRHTFAGAPEAVTEIHHFPFPSSNSYFPPPQLKHFRNSKVLTCWSDRDHHPYQTSPHWARLVQLTGPCHHRHRSTKLWPQILRESWFHFLAATLLAHEDRVSYLNQCDSP